MAIPLLIPTLVSGVASAGGSVVDALSKRLSKEERRRRKELEERQESGTLGLTDEERSVAQAQLVDPIRASMREEFLRSRAGSLADPGQVARGSLARQDATARTLADTGRQISTLDFQVKRDQEAELGALNAKRAAARAAAGLAPVEVLMGGAGTASDMMSIAEERLLLREERNARYPGGTDAEKAEFDEYSKPPRPERMPPPPPPPEDPGPPASPASSITPDDVAAYGAWVEAGRPDGTKFSGLPATRLAQLDALYEYESLKNEFYF